MSDSSYTSSAVDQPYLEGTPTRRWFAAVLIALAIVFFVAAGWTSRAAAQDAPAQSVNTEELRDLVRTLESDEARAELVKSLKALIEARRAIRSGDDGSATADNWLARFSSQLRTAVGSVAELGRGIDISYSLSWLQARANDPAARQRALDGAIDVAAILAAGLLAYAIAAFVLLKPRRAIEQRISASLWARGLFGLLRFAIEFLPLGAGVAVALAAAGFVEPRPATRLIALALVNAMAAGRALVISAQLLFQPRTPNLRILPLSDETAHYLQIWTSRLGYVALYGYFLLEAALLMGLTRPAHAVLTNLLGAIVALLAIIFILQNRESVATQIRGPADAPGSLAALRRPLAAVWHLLAVFYVAALYLVLALKGDAGTVYIVRGTLITVAVLALAWTINRTGQAVIGRAMKIGDDLQLRFPGLQARLNRYTAAIRLLARGVIIFVAAIFILEAWGLAVFDWLASALGQRILSATVSIALIVTLALLTWELVGSLIERRLTAPASGRVLSTRALTLLPLARTMLRIVLIVLVGMVILDEIGVNITPLLAGAGFFGLAVGFGAQKLVQDVINGWFILMEDTIAVGDVVEVDGHSGVVERINIRTLQLRDITATVHTIPFSAVTTVKNLTRNFSYYLFELGVAYREDTDHVIEVLRQVDEEMRADATYGPLILEPLDVLGLERFADSAVVIRARTKTRPVQQWTVGREFNRRIKKAFDAAGIEMPFPHTTIYFGENRDGSAPAARIAVERWVDTLRPPHAPAASKDGDA